MAGVALIARVGGHKAFQELNARLIESKAVTTPFGKSAPIHIMRFEKYKFAVLSRHGEEQYTISSRYINYKAIMWALKVSGIEKIIAVGAGGSIMESINPGEIVLIEDVIDETGEDYSLFSGKGIGVIRQHPIFCPELRLEIYTHLSNSGLKCHIGGSYVSRLGPRLETKAEVKKYDSFGASLVGQTLAPEVFLAHELELCYVPLCYAVRWAEGVQEIPTKPGALFEGLTPEDDIEKVAKTESDIYSLFLKMLPNLQDTPRNCPCKNAMMRYRKRGDIGENWREWIK